MNFRDFDWLEQYEGWIDNGYCVALIKGLSPTEVLDLLRAGSDRPVVSGFSDIQLEQWDFEEDGLVDIMKTEVIGVADAGDGWSILVEQGSGYLGVTDELMRPMVANHEVVVHYSNIEALTRFVWWKDGVKQVAFETRMGAPEAIDSAVSPSVADQVTRTIAGVGGLPLSDDEPTPPGYSPTRGAFALASELAGVAVTPDLFRSGKFFVAVVPTTPDGVVPVKTAPGEPLNGTGPITWAQAIRLHDPSKKLTVHGVVTEVNGHPDNGASCEFWFKPRRSWVLSDNRGVFYVQNRRDTWFLHRSGLVLNDSGGFSMPLWPGRVIDYISEVVRDHGPQATAEGLIDRATEGRETVVDGRQAWEFQLPEIARGLPRAVSFDSVTGVIVRRVWGSSTDTLTGLEVGEPMGDEMFEGPHHS